MPLAPLTSFVDRSGELAELEAAFSRARLLTLTGAGGIGKTRLAIALLDRVGERSGGDVWRVELATLTDPELVTPAVGSAVGVHDASGKPLLDAIIEALREREGVLVLDSCEHNWRGPDSAGLDPP